MNHQSINILIVDDEVEFCASIEKFLNNEGYISQSVHNGIDAVAYVKKNKTDIILLDIRMPGIDGIETLKQIKYLDDDYIVILLTAVDDMNTAILAYDNGVSHILRKPVNLAELRFLIKETLDRRQLILELREYKSKFGK